MSAQKPVVVYAASGYTGRLACEALTRLRVPFVAAGRSQDKLDAIVREMRALGGDCEARVAPHTPEGLRALLSGARVVVNNSGPFSLLGHAVVEAALEAGAHYVDSTGEQDFMLDLRRDYGERYAQKQLVLAPSCAFLWGPGSVASELCLEGGGIDTLEIAYAPPSLQTVASLQSMVRTVRREGYSLEGGRMKQLPAVQTRKVVMPGSPAQRGAVSIGAGEMTYYLGDARMKNVSTLFVNDDLARVAPIFRTWHGLSKLMPGETLDRWSDALVLKLKKDPPAEDPEANRFVVTVDGRGAGREVRVVMRGTSPYVLTGFLSAVAAQLLVEGTIKRVGYASMGQAFGARLMQSRLAEAGTHMQLEEKQPGRAQQAQSAAAQS